MSVGRKQKRRKTYNINFVSIPFDVPWKPAPPPKPLKGVSPPKVVSGDPTGIIDKLPSMNLAATVGLWRNALEVLENPQKKHFRQGARQLLSALNAEWKRRGAGPERPEDWFKWPGTDAHAGDGSLSGTWLEEGVLKFLGYTVGKTSDLATPLREAILARIFSGEIPPAFPRAYLAEWGEPSSALRLRKMAECLAAFARNAKRRSDDRLDVAIADWEHDLQFLHDEYYVGRFRFAWPATTP